MPMNADFYSLMGPEHQISIRDSNETVPIDTLNSENYKFGPFELLQSNTSSDKRQPVDSPNFSFFEMNATGRTNISTALDT